MSKRSRSRRIYVELKFWLGGAGILTTVISGAFLLYANRDSGSPTPTISVLTLSPTATCCAVPPPTATPHNVSLPLNAVSDACRSGIFSDGSGDSYVAVAFGEGSCMGVTIGWSVPHSNSYAGCVIDLPADVLPLSEYSQLILRADGLHGGEHFQVGLVNDIQDAVTQHKEMVQVPLEGAEQPILINLDRFKDQNTTLDSLDHLVIGVNHDVGEGLRSSSICITEISFAR